MITANLFMFGILAVVILGSAIMCVFTKRIMRAATFLLFVLFGVAGMFFLLDYTYLGAAQISVYAGGMAAGGRRIRGRSQSEAGMQKMVSGAECRNIPEQRRSALEIRSPLCRELRIANGSPRMSGW